jgi:hypothetical protein
VDQNQERIPTEIATQNGVAQRKQRNVTPMKTTAVVCNIEGVVETLHHLITTIETLYLLIVAIEGMKNTLLHDIVPIIDEVCSRERS